eukprot:1801235-Amphidinium_carterae.1
MSTKAQTPLPHKSKARAGGRKEKGVFTFGQVASVARAAPKKHFQPRAQNGHGNNETSLPARLKTHGFK